MSREPFCPECGVFMFCKKNGVLVYKEKDYIYHADLWECKECRKQIITGFGDSPMHWYWTNPVLFEEKLEATIFKYKVSD